MKSKTICIVLFCIGLAPLSIFSQEKANTPSIMMSRGAGGTVGGGGIAKLYSLRFSPISISVSDNQQVEVNFILANTTYEMTVTNQSGYIVYKQYVNTQLTQQVIADFKGLPTNSYTVTFKNVATSELINRSFELK